MNDHEPDGAGRKSRLQGNVLILCRGNTTNNNPLAVDTNTTLYDRNMQLRRMLSFGIGVL